MVGRRNVRLWHRLHQSEASWAGGGEGGGVRGGGGWGGGGFSLSPSPGMCEVN